VRGALATGPPAPPTDSLAPPRQPGRPGRGGALLCGPRAPTPHRLGSMRRRLLLLAAAAVPSVAVLAVAAHGCSSEQPFESACLWLEDPDNCYREFVEDMQATANPNSPDNPTGFCKPGGNPTEASAS